jgi:hypothetical protein
MSAFSWRCQYCGWAFQMSSDAVAAALAAADATQDRHHVEHCPRCRKALKIPLDQLRHHAPLSAPAAPIRSLSYQEDKKPMSDIPAPFPPAEPPAPEPAPMPMETPAPVAVPAPMAPKPAVKKVVKRTVKKVAKKKVAKKPAKRKAVKKVAKKSAKKPAKKKTAKKAKKGKKK